MEDSSEKLYCICRKPEDDRRMIECSACKEWFHLNCIGMEDTQASRMTDEDIPYFCKLCLVEQCREPSSDNEATQVDNRETQNTSRPLSDSTATNVGQTSSRNKRPVESSAKAKEPQAGPSKGKPAHKERTTSSRSIKIVTESPDKDYEVQSITGIKTDADGKIFYRIKWKQAGSKETWEPVENCDRCATKINVFRKSRNLPPIPVPYGASDRNNTSYNVANWLDMEDIMENIEIFSRNRIYPEQIEILPFEGELGQEDAVFIIGCGNHCFVGLFITSEKCIYLSDGGNQYIQDDELKNLVRNKLGRPIRIVPIPFYQQKGIDHCASTAVLLALEYKRIYQTLEIPKQIRVQKWLQERLTAKVHKEPSDSLSKWTPISDRGFDYCQHCGKEFRERNQKRYLNHQRMCKEQK